MRRWLLFMALLLLLFCTACSGNVTVKPWADLHMPGVTKIPGIEGLQDHESIDRVYSAMTYSSSLDGNAIHVLFENGQKVYDMRLDGSQLHPVALPCSDSVAVAPGGQWVACRAQYDIVLHDLAYPEPDITLTGAGEYPGYPTWAPDGHHLAAVVRLGDVCSIAVFDISFASGTNHLIALLGLPRFTDREPTGIGCSSAGLTWSPDGTQIAFIDIDTRTLYSMPVASLHLLTRSDTLSPINQQILGDQLLELGRCGLNGSLTWMPSSHLLTYVDFLGWNIDQIDVATHDKTTLLAQHSAGIFGLSWTPDGKHLLFVLGLTSDELIVPPSQLYLYSPTAT